MKERFTDKVFKDEQMKMIRWADGVLTKYQKEGYSMTVRQLFYAAVSINLLPNVQPEYSKLGDLLTDARLAGYLDWDAIVDRGRMTREIDTYESPLAIMRQTVSRFKTDKWQSQSNYVEAMIEKQALEGVVAPVCAKLEIPFTSNKGYASSTIAYDVAKRLQERRRAGKMVHILYAGDHDPSGLDMGRNLKERLELLSDGTVYIHRIALNRDQIDHHHLPANPAKDKDPRYPAYKELHGKDSWEMDALPLEELAGVFTKSVMQLRDERLWQRDFQAQEEMRDQLQAMQEELEPTKKGGDDFKFRPL